MSKEELSKWLYEQFEEFGLYYRDYDCSADFEWTRDAADNIAELLLSKISKQTTMSNNKRYRSKESKVELKQVGESAVVNGKWWGMFIRDGGPDYPLCYGSHEIEEIKEPERIEVSGFGSLAGLNRPEGYRITYTFNTNAPIPEEKYPLIKQAIEDVLNFKDEINYVPLSKVVQDFISRQYTEDDIKDAVQYAAFKDPKSYLFSECQSDYDVAEKIFNQWKSQRK
jgi:hypothetical protein